MLRINENQDQLLNACAGSPDESVLPAMISLPKKLLLSRLQVPWSLSHARPPGTPAPV
ncbi:hypothetical protein [Pseudomonas corrugata]|uniref:hypothetical protein n=1 Tax=Pseudomonas corrugata TaxID=47879 RepID=UPI002234E1BD|nr:hypothetical protein [Pseudomonas corrugata]UZE04074.1 hypothetical protein LOY65_15310 [Pseudomonas corrugata]